MMPAHPRPGFIMIHADFTFGLFEDRFDRPALPAHIGHRARCDTDRRVAQVIPGFGRFRQTASKDGPDARSGQAITSRGDTQPDEISDQRTFAAFLNGQTLPASLGQVAGQRTQFLSGRRIQPHARMNAWTPQQARASRFHRGRVQPHASIVGNLGEIPFTQCRYTVQKSLDFGRNAHHT